MPHTVIKAVPSLVPGRQCPDSLQRESWKRKIQFNISFLMSVDQHVRAATQGRACKLGPSYDGDILFYSTEVA